MYAPLQVTQSQKEFYSVKGGIAKAEKKKTEANPAINQLHLLYIIGRHTLDLSVLLDIRPSIARIHINQHEALALSHTMLCVALRRVIVHSLDVLEFLGAAFGRYGGAFLFASRTGNTR
jgi:hypothetical protein